jgi:hypothetical protein
VLFCAPVYWVSDYSADSAHQWDWVKAETPLDKKPTVELEIASDARSRVREVSPGLPGSNCRVAGQVSKTAMQRTDFALTTLLHGSARRRAPKAAGWSP